MGYGLGVFLLALGLILALAVNDSLNGVDLTMVGWILALAGLLVIALTRNGTPPQVSPRAWDSTNPPALPSTPLAVVPPVALPTPAESPTAPESAPSASPSASPSADSENPRSR